MTTENDSALRVRFFRSRAAVYLHTPDGRMDIWGGTDIRQADPAETVRRRRV